MYSLFPRYLATVKVLIHLKTFLNAASQATDFKMHQHAEMTKSVEIKMIKRQDNWLQDLTPDWNLHGTL